MFTFQTFDQCNCCVQTTLNVLSRANTPDLETATLNVAPERRSRVYRVSLLFPAARVCRYMASCLWRGLSRSSEPTHMHLWYTYVRKHIYKWGASLNRMNRMPFNEISTDPPRCRTSCCRSRSCQSVPCAPPVPQYRRTRTDLPSSHCVELAAPPAELTHGLARRMARWREEEGQKNMDKVREWVLWGKVSYTVQGWYEQLKKWIVWWIA